MDDRGLQGWARDPFRLHESRYFSAGRPTKLVRDGTVECYDEPPSDAFVPAAAAAGSDRSGRATAAAPGASVATAPPPSRGDPPVPGDLASLSAPPDPRYAPRPPRRRRVGLVAAVAAIAVAIIVVVLDGQVSRSPTTTNQTLTLTSPAAFVTHSAEQTLAARTVDLTLSGRIQILGVNVTVGGTGEFNFDTNAMAVDIRMHDANGLFEEKEVLVNGNLYYAFSVNGAGFTKLTGGREWIQTPAQQSETANLAGSDPLSSLSVLEQQGSTVRPLGSKTIDGVNCTGYAVTPSLQAMITATREEDAKLGVSSATTEQDVQQDRSTPPPTITIWSDAQGLVRQLSINLPINVQGGPPTGDLVMDFSHFGAPVSITAPAPSDTISYSSFLQSLGHNAA